MVPFWHLITILLTSAKWSILFFKRQFLCIALLYRPDIITGFLPCHHTAPKRFFQLFTRYFRHIASLFGYCSICLETLRISLLAQLRSRSFRHCFKGSAFLDGIDCTILNIPSKSVTSVRYFFPSAAGNFSW